MKRVVFSLAVLGMSGSLFGVPNGIIGARNIYGSNQFPTTAFVSCNANDDFSIGSVEKSNRISNVPGLMGIALFGYGMHKFLSYCKKQDVEEWGPNITKLCRGIFGNKFNFHVGYVDQNGKKHAYNSALAKSSSDLLKSQNNLEYVDHKGKEQTRDSEKTLAVSPSHSSEFQNDSEAESTEPTPHVSPNGSGNQFEVLVGKAVLIIGAGALFYYIKKRINNWIGSKAVQVGEHLIRKSSVCSVSDGQGYLGDLINRATLKAAYDVSSSGNWNNFVDYVVSPACKIFNEKSRRTFSVLMSKNVLIPLGGVLLMKSLFWKRSVKKSSIQYEGDYSTATWLNERT